MPEFSLTKPTRPIHVGVVLMNRFVLTPPAPAGVPTPISEPPPVISPSNTATFARARSITEALDVVPVDLLHGLSHKFLEAMPTIIPEALKNQGLPIEFHWVSENGSKDTRELSSGLNVTPTDSFATCPPLDIVLVGASHIDYVLTANERAFIQKSYDSCTAFMTVCGGVLVAVAAGLVAGKTVTGPRLMLPQLRAMAPDAAAWVEKRYVHDGKLWTSGALHNGLDMMAAFMRHTWPNDEGQKLSLVDFALVAGSGIERDIDYKDEPLLDLPAA